MRTISAAAILVALIFTGCASKSTTSSVTSSSPQASSTEAPAASPPVSLSGTVNNHGTKDLSANKTITVSLEQDNFYFNPTFVKAAPGSAVTVNVKNEGKAPHTFTIDSPKVDVVVQPDTSKTVTFTLPSTGTVNFYCRFHRSMGMQGAFFFTAGSSGAMSPAPSAASSGSSGY